MKVLKAHAGSNPQTNGNIRNQITFKSQFPEIYIEIKSIKANAGCFQRIKLTAQRYDRHISTQFASVHQK